MNLYTPEFYRDQQDESWRSAQKVLKIVFDATRPQSMVDVGCGVGTWLHAANQLGVNDVFGFDGDYVDLQMLKISPDKFGVADLRYPLHVHRTFDLAICLEVAEHLPEECASALVGSLVALAPVILFSAAIPYQGGTGHVNEQWQDYWVKLFRTKDYLAVDLVRPQVWDVAEVEYWYAQNTLIMVDQVKLANYPILKNAFDRSFLPYSLVHPRAFLRTHSEIRSLHNRGLWSWLTEGPAVVKRTLRNRLRLPLLT